MTTLFISRWTIDPVRRDEFVAAFDALYTAAAGMLAEHTTALFYGWSRDNNEFVAIEAWKSEEMVRELRRSSEFKSHFASMMQFSTAPMRMELVTDLTNDRRIFDEHPVGRSTVHPDISPGTIYL